MNTSIGLAVLCDLDGRLIRVLHDEIGLGAALQVGLPFARVAVAGCLAKALSFVLEVRERGVALGWELNVELHGTATTLSFTGSRLGDTLVIVGGESGQIARWLCEELTLINTEQTNLLRAALKENSRAGRDAGLYDEISRLNNELVAIQRELARKNAELEALNREKNRFLGMAAHDLRSPLGAILTASEMLLSGDLSAGEDGRELLRVIYASSEFMVNLVNNLLDVAKIEAGELQLEYSVVDWPDFMQRSAGFNRMLAARKQIELDYQVDESLPAAVIDGGKFEQVLNNLVGNALKFSHPGGRVSVRLAGDEPGWFRLSVEDHGVGIAPEQMPLLFRAFQRGAQGTRGEKSTGLGLVIVKRIVVGHGGKIWAESQPGQGTTFYVVMPLRPVE